MNEVHINGSPLLLLCVLASIFIPVIWMAFLMVTRAKGHGSRITMSVLGANLEIRIDPPIIVDRRNTNEN